MVHGVCRRVLRRAEDAEDAFQAAFMVLARKARTVAWGESVGRWLYQVAYRVAAEARTRNARREALEKRAAERLKPSAVSQEGLREVCDVLDEALYDLPARYQQPLLLCYLQGLTRDQAAAQLGWSLRTLWRDLARAAPDAHRAISKLADVPAQAVPFLGTRLTPAAALPADELQRLVSDLDSPTFRRRDEASRRLTDFGDDAEPTLHQALANKPSAEARQRIERLATSRPAGYSASWPRERPSLP